MIAQRQAMFYIYIPIWLYSNENGHRKFIHGVDTFTFQSGYIQIYHPIPWKMMMQINLHSNLVIFKYQVICIKDMHMLNLHSNLVIFK